MDSGDVWGTGRNWFGQLGDGSTTNRKKPVKSLASGIQRVTAGYSHTLFITTTGAVLGVGTNRYGELGTAEGSSTLEEIFPACQVAEADAGEYYSIFRMQDGSVLVTGDNYYGQLGIGGHTVKTPAVLFPNNIKSISAGWYHTLYVTGSGVKAECS